MSSQSQVLANRLNAQKSTGPQTAEGKAVVSQNALKHGLSAALGALLGQRHVDNLVRLLFGKRAMGLRAVVGARLAARLFRVRLGRSLGERGGLTFLGPRGLLQELLQLCHPLLEFSDPPFEPGTVGTPCCCTCITSHAPNIGKMAA